MEYLALIAISTMVDYVAASTIASSQHMLKRLAWLSASLATNLGLLFLFKYSSWFMNDVASPLRILNADMVGRFNEFWHYALPVGISFYTFQTMSYTVDVYFGRVQPERNPFKFALFVSFFPQLVAGPIERFSRLHHQLFEPKNLTYENLQHGGRLILYGLFIKMCVADNVAPLVDQIFGEYQSASSVQLLWGMVLFGIQIFSDFHGYSLIAIGSARLLGIALMDNFNSPYSSLSIREFWTRWHISLSTWFRDYVFIPLGGSRASIARWSLNILIVFLVSGLWHGANWTFLAWGAIHGLAYLIERVSNFNRMESLFMKPIRWLITSAVVFLAWVFFRSENIETATSYIYRMFSGVESTINMEWSPLLLSFVGLFLISDFVFKFGNIHDWLNSKRVHIRWGVYALLTYSIMAHSGTINHPFIYFQF
ncbi:MAG: MBOAT family O-acyltransferase [Flavobacteriales bacterium]